MNLSTNVYLKCRCHADEHLVVLEYDSEWGPQIKVQTRPFEGFWKRLKAAFKFVFLKGGELSWDGALVRDEDLPEVQRWLDAAVFDSKAEWRS